LILFILIRRRVTFKLRMLRLWQTNFGSYEESTSSPIRGLFTDLFKHSVFSHGAVKQIGSWHLFQMILRRSSTACVSTARITCVRWWFSRVPAYSLSSCRSTSVTIRSTTHCASTRRQSSNWRASSRRTIQSTTDRCWSDDWFGWATEVFDWWFMLCGSQKKFGLIYIHNAQREFTVYFTPKTIATFEVVIFGILGICHILKT